jgi:uncharacterized protein YlxW (UPF0749 family)
MVKKWHFYITAITLISGILIVSLFRTNKAVQEASANDKTDNLISIIEQQENDINTLEETIANLHEQIAAIQEDQAAGEERSNTLSSYIENLRVQAGLTPLEGPGIKVILDDNPKGAEAAKTSDILTYIPENYIIHDKNVLYLVNDLKNAGAEAISVNNQRIVSTSNIRCVGTVILVNSTRMAPPYEITAIGDPDQLEQGVLEGQEYDFLKRREFPVKIEKYDTVEIPAYRGNYTPLYARDVKLEVTEIEKE